MTRLQAQMSFVRNEKDLLLHKKRETLSHHASNVRPSVRPSQNSNLWQDTPVLLEIHDEIHPDLLPPYFFPRKLLNALFHTIAQAKF